MYLKIGEMTFAWLSWNLVNPYYLLTYQVAKWAKFHYKGLKYFGIIVVVPILSPSSIWDLPMPLNNGVKIVNFWLKSLAK